MNLPTKDAIFAGYTGQPEWLKDNTFFLTAHGSHAYGTNVEGSDFDFKGVTCAPMDYSTGFTDRFEQAEGCFGEFDGAIFDVRKFIHLAAQCNPSVLEILWADPSTWIFNGPEVTMDVGFVPRQGNYVFPTCWEAIYEARWDFLSQEVKARYSGYAVSQARKLELHRSWLLSPPQKKPERADFGLKANPEIPKEQREFYESQMKKVVEGWEVDFGALDYSYRIEILNKLAENLADMRLTQDDQYLLAAQKIGLQESTVQMLKDERKYQQALKHWHQYQDWKVNRNPKRAEMEDRFGYDLKHAMHCIRLQRTCIEILQGKGVLVKRPDAEELVSIRNGAWSYDRWMQEVRKLGDQANELVKVTKLPKTSNYKRANFICQAVVEKMWGI